MQLLEVTVGKLRVVHTVTAILPAGEEIRAVFGADSFPQPIDLTVRFVDKPNTSTQIKVEGQSGGPGVLTFVNWANGFGTATQSPTQFVRLSNGADLYLSAVVWAIGTAKFVVVQFLVGEPQ